MSIELLDQLSPAQQRAVTILQTCLNCYNSATGTGLFNGVGRYQVLTDRTRIAAIQARDLAGFWAILLRKMQWSVPPKNADIEILSLLDSNEPMAILKCLAQETQFVIMLARVLHDEDKSEAKQHWQGTQAAENAGKEII